MAVQLIVVMLVSTLNGIIPYINKDVIKKCGKHEKTVKITYVIDKNSLLIKEFK